MGNNSSTTPETTKINDNNNETKKKHPCCVCKDTRSARDLCIAEYGPEFEKCVKLIQKHKECMRNEGFDVK